MLAEILPYHSPTMTEGATELNQVAEHLSVSRFHRLIHQSNKISRATHNFLLNIKNTGYFNAMNCVLVLGGHSVERF